MIKPFDNAITASMIKSSKYLFWFVGMSEFVTWKTSFIAELDRIVQGRESEQRLFWEKPLKFMTAIKSVL